MLKLSCGKLNFILLFFMAVSILINADSNEKELSSIEAILQKKINLKIDQEPIEEFFARLRKICKTPIVTSSKINLQKNIQISFSDVTVKDAIYWVCEKYKLDYEIKRGALYFLDLDESLKKKVVLKVYDIRFLQQVPINDLAGLHSYTENLFNDAGAGITDPLEVEDGDSALYIGKTIDSVIRNKIPNGNWGSPETLLEINGHSLRVKNTPKIQEAVETLLQLYHEKFGIQVQSEVTIISLPRKEYNEYILNELNGSNILSAAELKSFLTKKRLLWQNQKVLFSGSTVSYNSFSTNISIYNRKDTLFNFRIIDGEYDAIHSRLLNDDGVSILPLANKNQSEVILTVKGQYSPNIDLVTPKLENKNQALSIDKTQVEIAKFETSAKLKNGGGVLISIGSNALNEMSDQLIVFCISSKINKKE